MLKRRGQQPLPRKPGAAKEGLKTARRLELDRDIVQGLLWCVGGLTVTVSSYVAAVDAGGGTYVVAVGAIL